MTRSIGYITFGTLSHAASWAALIAFLLFLQDAIPREWLAQPLSNTSMAVLINFGLAVIWSLQHSGMASAKYEAWARKFVPVPLERSLYCTVSSAMLLLLVFGWAPMPYPIFEVQSEVPETMLNAAFRVWGLFGASLMSDSYWEFFGMNQICYVKGSMR